MKKLLPLLLLLSAPAYADITSKFTTSVSVKVDAAMTQASRIGASYSAQGQNIGTSNTNDQLGGLSVSNGAVTLNAGNYSINGCGSDDCATTWSLSESFTAADTIPSSNSNITAGTVPNFGSVISTVAGSGTGSGGTPTSAHAITGINEGGAGSTVTGQFVTELTIR